jgi:hypothetical protein
MAGYGFLVGLASSLMGVSSGSLLTMVARFELASGCTFDPK